MLILTQKVQHHCLDGDCLKGEMQPLITTIVLYIIWFVCLKIPKEKSDLPRTMFYLEISKNGVEIVH